MSEPSREHIGAIHDVIDANSALYDLDCAQVAQAILTSTDPAVLDAMQDVLVRAGRLRESLTAAWDDDQPDMSGQPQRARAGSFRNRETADRAVTYYQGRGRAAVVERRLVTEWREVES